ncbi:hypothetical protein QWY86_05410 [Pedobacter aquatilis]|uniref:DUF6615 family protein n=1 Tax=Pedobacter aquatilis TaxID=351343 RepID=UPI0025B58D80|nr:DUF6615 family protein [Pedobacter aquatilis]MDN3586094.1 hypothetical protein [Pedobacter aquatilis]
MSIEHYLRGLEAVGPCELLRAVEQDTWARIGFTRETPGLRIMETTVTQNIVYELRLLKHRFGHIGYTLFESRNEKANGHDLLLRILSSKSEVYTYALQAKIIYHNLGDVKKGTHLDDGTYPQFKHMVGKGPKADSQVNILLDYAKKRGYIPMYLMYNYVRKKHPRSKGPGCTVVGAQKMKDLFPDASGKDLSDKVRYSQLHFKHAFPLSDLACIFSGLDDELILEASGLPPDYALTKAPRSALRIDGEWLKMEDENRVMEFIQPRPLSTSRQGSNEPNDTVAIPSFGFNPRFQLELDLRNRHY